MAFEKLKWYPLKRAVTEVERAAKLDTDSRCCDRASDSQTVFTANGSYLEVCDGNHFDKGWGLFTFLLPGLGSLAISVMILWMMTHIPQAVKENGQAGLVVPLFTPILIVMLGLFGITVWALLTDCFGYTRNPIRLSRATRMIYVFRRNGPSGVLSVPWDKAFFYIERRRKAGLSLTVARVVRCLVLDDNGKVVDTFSIGRRVVLASDEQSLSGQAAMNRLLENFEYYRRYMEEGPSSVPSVRSLLPTTISFRNSLSMQFEDASDILESRQGAQILIFALTALPSFILAVLYFIAQLTCREPVWPEDVERACNATANPVEGVAS